MVFQEVIIFPYDLDFVVGAMIGEFVRSVGKHSNTVRLLGYNSHFCHVLDVNVLCRVYWCHRVVSFTTERKAWSVMLSLALKELNMYTQRACISSVKHIFTNLTCLVFLMQTNKALQRLGNIWFWIDLCGRWRFQRHVNKDIKWERRFKMGIDIVQLDTIAILPLQSWTSWFGINIHWCVGEFGHVKWIWVEIELFSHRNHKKVDMQVS